jgi:hypothetical protein
MHILFQGVLVESVDFSPVSVMAHELFTHLSLACKCFSIDAGRLMVNAMIVMTHNGGAASEDGSEHSDDEFLGLEVEELLEEVT